MPKPGAARAMAAAGPPQPLMKTDHRKILGCGTGFFFRWLVFACAESPASSLLAPPVPGAGGAGHAGGLPPPARRPASHELQILLFIYA